ncbi:putative transposase [Nitrosospira sp. Nsp2]|nr:putative transposase [Nitrosospira sp. Nsp2]
MVLRLAGDQKLSIRQSCQLVNLSRAAYYRDENKLAVRDAPVIEALNAIVARHGRWGFWKCHHRLRLKGHHWNHKRVWRVYCAMKLNLPRRTKKRLIRPMQPLDAPQLPNEVWSLDFMSDSLYQGRRFRTLNILDESVREALAIEIDTSLPAQRVVRTLQQLEVWRGLPKAIRLDNGPELTSQYLADWCQDKGIELRFIQPGKPNQNAFIERFNRSYRTEVLNNWLFTSLDEVREITHQWLQSYNEERPHDALGSLPPAVFREQLLTGKNSTSELST